MTSVDRSQQASVHLTYTIPYEDVAVTPDEVLTSRRHQFLAFCRDHSRQVPLPHWVTWKDVEDAAASELIDLIEIDDEDVLETSMEWQDCWYRITDDDERREITFAEAMKGVDWDTTGLPTGAYIVQGYTWEPPFNIFAPRPGVLHIVDGSDLGPVGPAMATTKTENVVFGGDTLDFKGCIRAMPGSTISGFWSSTNTEIPDWQMFIQDVAPIGETFTIPFTPAKASSGETIVLYFEVMDPMARSFAAHARELVAVLPGTGETACDTDGSFIGPSCADESSSGPTSTGTATSEGTGATTPSEIDPGSVGCGCITGGGRPLGWLLLLALFFARRRGCGHGSGAEPRTWRRARPLP